MNASNGIFRLYPVSHQKISRCNMFHCKRTTYRNFIKLTFNMIRFDILFINYFEKLVKIQRQILWGVRKLCISFHYLLSISTFQQWFPYKWSWKLITNLPADRCKEMHHDRILDVWVSPNWRRFFCVYHICFYASRFMHNWIITAKNSR